MGKVSFTKSGSVITINHEGKSYPINKTHPNYEAIRKIVVAKKGGLERILPLLNIANTVEKQGKGRFKVVAGVVLIDGQPINDALSRKIIEFLTAKRSVDALVKFWLKVKQNPDPRAQSDLYPFISKTGHAITQDGDFIAYKHVTKEFKDHRTKTFDYRIGRKPKMKRELCDPDPNQTCSRGLHVANYNYAWGFNNEGHLIDCKVNPKDVVAIPTDYNSEKMRVCAFEVVGVNTGGQLKTSYISTRALRQHTESAPIEAQKRRTFYKMVDGEIQTTRRVICPPGWRDTRPKVKAKTEVVQKAPAKRRTYYKLVGRRVYTIRATKCPEGYQSRKPQ